MFSNLLARVQWLILMVRGGLSPLAALQTAAINPARYLGLEQSLGSVQRGESADLVLLEANPLENIANVRRVSAVVLDGKLLTRAELDTILKRTKDKLR